VRGEGLLRSSLWDGEADKHAEHESECTCCKRDREAVAGGVSVVLHGGGKDRRHSGAAESAADGPRDGVHAGRDSCLGRTDVLDDQVDHCRERESDAHPEQERGKVHLPTLVPCEGEDGVRRGGEHGAGEQRWF
jgi:hypothetical protein